MKHTVNASVSAIGPAYITPSIPNIIGRPTIRGIRNITCLVSDINTPFLGFPIAVKKLEDSGCKKQRNIPNK